jgi:hypothetical protein
MHAYDWGCCGDTRELQAPADEVCAMLYSLRKKVLERGSANP